MRSNCPNCGAAFELPTGFDSEIDCPNCHTMFVPVDQREMRAQARIEATDEIRAIFSGFAGDNTAQEILEELTTDTPIPGKGGYIQRENRIEQLVDMAMPRSDLLSALGRAMGVVQDWYLCRKILATGLVSSDAELSISQAAMSAQSLGGQSGDYFKLLGVLAASNSDVRDWCVSIRNSESGDTILAENMDLVLSGRA